MLCNLVENGHWFKSHQGHVDHAAKEYECECLQFDKSPDREVHPYVNQTVSY